MEARTLESDIRPEALSIPSEVWHIIVQEKWLLQDAASVARSTCLIKLAAQTLGSLRQTCRYLYDALPSRRDKFAHPHCFHLCSSCSDRALRPNIKIYSQPFPYYTTIYVDCCNSAVEMRRARAAVGDTVRRERSDRDYSTNTAPIPYFGCRLRHDTPTPPPPPPRTFSPPRVQPRPISAPRRFFPGKQRRHVRAPAPLHQPRGSRASLAGPMTRSRKYRRKNAE